MEILKRLTQTCEACPSQWEGFTQDDKPVYIRYRWGCLTIQIGDIGGTIANAVRSPDVLCKQIGNNVDGSMGIGEVVRHAKGILDFSQL